jgi:predicted Zn-dependent protease
MSLDLDPIFYTETMVKLLREQGSNPSAIELAEKILEKDPNNESVAKLLADMKEEARLAFDRFQKGGHPEKAAAAPDKKVRLLNNLLGSVQEFRKHHESR